MKYIVSALMPVIPPFKKFPFGDGNAITVEKYYLTDGSIVMSGAVFTKEGVLQFRSENDTLGGLVEAWEALWEKLKVVLRDDALKAVEVI